jgi:monooxygenase
MTLVPAMAEDAGQVTMLQRSPSYVISIPNEDSLAGLLRRLLPDRAAYWAVRWRNVLLQLFTYRLARKRPELAKKLLRRGVERALPPGYEIDTHFKPRYDPWDQRLCMVPDSDLFEAIGRGEAEIVTGSIETFTESGVRLEDGRELEADIVITATGLNLLFLGGMRLSVDGEEPDVAKAFTYKGMMLSGVPNFAFTIGYTNASWTLKADLAAEYICRLLNHMQAAGYRQCVPRASDPSVTEQPLLDFTSGYVVRSLHLLPKQGSKEPWRLKQNYPMDLRTLRYGPIDDGTLQFSTGAPAATPLEQATA